jgi:CheY-like chemotaxis protein
MSSLGNKTVLLVEDEALIGAMAADMLSDLGATVIGPVCSVAKALAMAKSDNFDVAVLDVNVRGERIDPVADALAARGIPVLLATGYGVADKYSVIEKPYTQDKLERGLLLVLQKKS